MAHASTARQDVRRASRAFQGGGYDSNGPLVLRIPDEGPLSMPCQEIFACGHTRWRNDISWADWYAQNQIVPILPCPSSAAISSPQRAYHFYTTSTCGQNKCYRQVASEENLGSRFHTYTAQEAKSVDLIRNELDRLRIAFLELGENIRACQIQTIAEVEHVGLEDCGIKFWHSEDLDDSSDLQLGYDLPEFMDAEIYLARLEAAIEVGTPRIFYDVACGKAFEKLRQLCSKLTAFEIFTKSLQTLEDELRCRNLLDAIPQASLGSIEQSPILDIDRALERENLAMAIFRPEIITWEAACETLSDESKNHFKRAETEHLDDEDDNTRLSHNNSSESKRPKKGPPEPLQKLENLHERVEFKARLPRLERRLTALGSGGIGLNNICATKPDATDMRWMEFGDISEQSSQ